MLTDDKFLLCLCLVAISLSFGGLTIRAAMFLDARVVGCKLAGNPFREACRHEFRGTWPMPGAAHGLFLRPRTGFGSVLARAGLR
jgi:hypothetical protein